MGFFKKLLKPKWMSEADYIAAAGVKEVDDPETLRQIVDEAPSWMARYEALKKLDDPDLYREIALTSEDRRLVEAVTDHVDDIPTLEAIWDRRILLTFDLHRRIDAMRRAEIIQQIRNMHSVNDSVQLVRLATADPKDDKLKIRDSEWGDLKYPLPWTEEDNLREAAVNRLAALEDDAALMQVIRQAAARNVKKLAASRVTDKKLLEEIVREGDNGDGWLGLVIKNIDNADLLRTLSHPAAEQRLCELPCIDGQDHDWYLISEDVGDIYADRRTDTEVQRCFKCDIERTTTYRIGLW